MIKKLKSLYPNSILFHNKLDESLSLARYYLFCEQSNQDWIGIPREDLSEKELTVLQTIFELYEPISSSNSPDSMSPQAKAWHHFLFDNGQTPAAKPEAYIRFTQFTIKGNDIEKTEIESALMGFFSEKVLIVWENDLNGVVIENNRQKFLSFSEKELLTMTETLESDFYIDISLYYGKQYLFSNELPQYFQEEKDYFSFAVNMLEHCKVFSFERVFPDFMAYHLPEDIKAKLNKVLGDVFQEDMEMFATMKVFLENNLNASLTAKRLYIHRNTLQYRVDKFTEKTGIQLKDFYGAFTVFLACLIFDSKLRN